VRLDRQFCEPGGQLGGDVDAWVARLAEPAHAPVPSSELAQVGRRAVRGRSGYLPGIAKIDHSFTMQGTPERAQSRFLEDIAPEVHRKAGLALYEDNPGLVKFSDGIVDPMVDRRDGLMFSVLRRATASWISVDFEPGGDGTRVTISGCAARDLRDAVDRLGQPGHWPDAGRNPA
jgi:hypothetical protein